MAPKWGSGRRHVNVELWCNICPCIDGYILPSLPFQGLDCDPVNPIKSLFQGFDLGLSLIHCVSPSGIINTGCHNMEAWVNELTVLNSVEGTRNKEQGNVTTIFNWRKEITLCLIYNVWQRKGDESPSKYKQTQPDEPTGNQVNSDKPNWCHSNGTNKNRHEVGTTVKQRRAGEAGLNTQGDTYRQVRVIRSN